MTTRLIGSIEPKEAVRVRVVHLGFEKVGSAFREEMKAAINEAIRLGIAYDAEMNRKAPLLDHRGPRR